MLATRPRNLLVLSVALAWMGLASCAFADITMTARVDRDVLAKDETLEFTVTVAGGGMSLVADPSLPSLDGLRVIGTASQQSISLVNGAMQSSINHIYSLQPMRTGKLTIGAVTLTVGGQTYRTEPIAVTVTPAIGRPGAGPPMPHDPFGPGMTPDFGLPTGKAAEVKHSVDHKTAYVGQQITYIFTFMQAERLFGDVEYSPADTPGFVAEDLPNPPQGTQNLDGRLYSVQRRQKALFATAPGKHTVGQASVTATVDPLSGPEDLIAPPIAVTVLPLPQAGQPAGFSGAVGSFAVRMKVDRPVVRAGETVNCVVEVTGSGNVRSLGAPRLVLPDWVRTYKAGEKRTVRPGGGGGDPAAIGGVVSFSYLLLPRQAGTLTIPPVSYSTFDPVGKAYRTARSEGATITVTPGSGAAPPIVPADNLRPLKLNLGRPAAAPLAGSLWFWLLMALPLVAVLRAGWQRWREIRVMTAPAQVRAASALALAHKRIGLAEEALRDGRTDEFYQALNAALLDYVADRTSAPPSGLTADLAYDLLREHGAEAELADLTRRLIERSAAGRFAPGAAEERTALQLAVECRQTLAALQRQVRPDA
jgi:hypothetical protein